MHKHLCFCTAVLVPMVRSWQTLGFLKLPYQGMHNHPCDMRVFLFFYFYAPHIVCANLFHFSNISWSQSNAPAGASSPPARSHACSVLLNHLVIVHGGMGPNDSSTWMFNTVSNQWSPLFSAKTQQPGNIPSPRWGHACQLAATPGITSSLAKSMIIIGGISSESVKCL